jgi:hypothetical protein
LELELRTLELLAAEHPLAQDSELFESVTRTLEQLHLIARGRWSALGTSSLGPATAATGEGRAPAAPTASAHRAWIPTSLKTAPLGHGVTTAERVALAVLELRLG